MAINGRCPCCENQLIPIKLYAPEILKIFSEGKREYSKNGILVNYSVCLSPHCRVGQTNLNSFDRVKSDGLIRD